MAEYAVVIDPDKAAEFQDHLVKMRDQLERAAHPDDYSAVQSNLRGELRLYRDDAAALLDKLRRDTRGAEGALRNFAAGFTANNADHEERLHAELRTLAAIQEIEDLGRVKQTVRNAAAGIGASWQELNRANQLVIAQLHDEIQALHRQMDNEHRAQFTDTVSGAWNRQKVSRRIDDHLGRGDNFCVILAAIANFKAFVSGYSPLVVERTLTALVKRIYGVAGKDAMVGRWCENEFAVLMEAEAAHGLWVSGKIARALSSRYSIQEDGCAQNIVLIVDTSLIDYHRGRDPQKFREKLAAFSGPAPRD